MGPIAVVQLEGPWQFHPMRKYPSAQPKPLDVKPKNIWAVGRNYLEHAKEMGQSAPREPMFFLKAGSCATWSSAIELPDWATEVHHEIEVAFRLGSTRNITHVGLALDLTERKLQAEAKAQGRPWTLSKSFTNSCPLSGFVETSMKDLDSLQIDFSLAVDGTTRQQGRLSEAVFSPSKLIQWLLEHFPVEEGDLLLTGTPSGVGPLQDGHRLVAKLQSYWTDSRQAGPFEIFWETQIDHRQKNKELQNGDPA